MECCASVLARALPAGRVKEMRVVLVAILMAAAGCRAAEPVREYRLVGQILAVDRQTNRVTIRHQDIDGFMPAMTMPFPVQGCQPAERTRRRGTGGRDAVGPGYRCLGLAADRHRQGTDHGGSAGTGSRARRPDRRCGAGRSGRRADASRGPARSCRRRVLYLYAVSAAGILPDDRSAAGGGAAGHQGRSGAGRHARPRGDARSGSTTRRRCWPCTRESATRTLSVWRFASGTADAIDAFGRQFGLAVTRTSSEPSGIEHNLRTVILDPDLRIVAMLTGSDWPASEAISALRTAAGAR